MHGTLRPTDLQKHNNCRSFRTKVVLQKFFILHRGQWRSSGRSAGMEEMCRGHDTGQGAAAACGSTQQRRAGACLQIYPPLLITACLGDLFSCCLIQISDLQELNLGVIQSYVNYISVKKIEVLPKDRYQCASDALHSLQKLFPLGQVHCKPLVIPTCLQMYLCNKLQNLCTGAPCPITRMPQMRENNPGHITKAGGKQAVILAGQVQFLTADICVTVIHSGGMWKCAPAESPSSTTP